MAYPPYGLKASDLNRLLMEEANQKHKKITNYISFPPFFNQYFQILTVCV